MAVCHIPLTHCPRNIQEALTSRTEAGARKLGSVKRKGGRSGFTGGDQWSWKEALWDAVQGQKEDQERRPSLWQEKVKGTAHLPVNLQEARETS